jgi:peptidoglycan/LPS O-acetylase OafA/YrhL
MARYRALDALRGLCASMVVLFHLNADTHFHHFFRNGSAGVDLFFVLSGFVLSAAYGDRIGRVQDVYVLLIRRFGRMYPLHFVILMIWVADVGVRSLYAGTSQFQDGFSVESLIESLFLVQGFTTNQLTWNFPTWSISVEIWMNVVYFWLMWLGKAAYRPFEIVLFGSLAGLALAMTLTDQDMKIGRAHV